MKSLRLVCCLLLAAVASVAWPFAFGQDAKPETADKDFAEELPKTSSGKIRRAELRGG